MSLNIRQNNLIVPPADTHVVAYMVPNGLYNLNTEIPIAHVIHTATISTESSSTESVTRHIIKLEAQ